MDGEKKQGSFLGRLVIQTYIYPCAAIGLHRLTGLGYGRISNHRTKSLLATSQTFKSMAGMALMIRKTRSTGAGSINGC